MNVANCFGGLCSAACWRTSARAQLPADAVMFDKVKIPEKQKSIDLCPVYLEPSDPKLPTWEYKGVKYRGSKADAQEKFLKDPDKYAKAAEKQRFVNNFMQAMSTIWCPVTDEVTPGGMTQWKRLGLHVRELLRVLRRERSRTTTSPTRSKSSKPAREKTYELIGAKYTEGAKSPVEGAIKRPDEAK